MTTRQASPAEDQAMPERELLHSRRSFLRTTMALSSSTAVGLWLGTCGAPQTTASTADATPTRATTPDAAAAPIASPPTTAAGATPTQAAARQAPATQGGQVTLPETDVHTLTASQSGHDYQIFVARPLDYAATDQVYATLYLMDAQLGFGLATEITRLLALSQELPPLLIISIGYPVENPFDTIPYRERDYVPSTWREDPEASSGEAFLQFIRDDLIPFVGAEYRVDADDRCLAGNSLAGVFALYTLFSQPDMFTRYVIGSPGIHVTAEAGEEVFRLEQVYAEQHDDLPARVFLSVGADEPDVYRTAKQRLESVLESRNYESLQLHTHIFEGETHFSVYPANTCRGLRVVYA